MDNHEIDWPPQVGDTVITNTGDAYIIVGAAKRRLMGGTVVIGRTIHDPEACSVHLRREMIRHTPR